MNKFIKKAISSVGGQSLLAKKLSNIMGKKIIQSTVRSWLVRDNIPGEYCYPVEIATNGAVKAIQLRPDIFSFYEIQKRKKGDKNVVDI